jgi:hypothetical protein
MPCTRPLLLIALALAGSAHAAGEEDESWISRYVASRQAPGIPARGDAQQLQGFEQLARHLGRQVRIALHDGREQQGVVESVDATGVRLRALLGSGPVEFGVARADLRGFRAE